MVKIIDYRTKPLQTLNAAVSAAEIRTHCRIDHTDEDVYLDRLVATAEAVMRNLGISVITTAFQGRLPAFPDGRIIALPVAPLVSVTSVTYYDADNTQQTLDASKYTVDSYAVPGQVQLAYTEIWPTTYDRTDAVEIEWTAGYGATSATAPADLLHAIELLVGHWYENRETVLIGTISKSIELAFSDLIQHHRIY